jgi:hypothetical protein
MRKSLEAAVAHRAMRVRETTNRLGLAPRPPPPAERAACAAGRDGTTHIQENAPTAGAIRRVTRTGKLRPPSTESTSSISSNPRRLVPAGHETRTLDPGSRSEAPHAIERTAGELGSDGAARAAPDRVPQTTATAALRIARRSISRNLTVTAHAVRF